MFPALRPNGIARWLAVVLALLGIAALLCLIVALSAGRSRGPATVRVPTATPEPATPVDAAPTVPVDDGPAGARREVAAGAGREQGERVRGATETLARALESLAFEEQAWRAAVAGEARLLGREALPALRALLADETRSPEEHVAASELVAALRAR